MGQLEKYGLYVLCLVIFLILGVTIWGDPDPVADKKRSVPAPISVPGSNSRPAATGTGSPVSTFQELFPEQAGPARTGVGQAAGTPPNPVGATPGNTPGNSPGATPTSTPTPGPAPAADAGKVAYQVKDNDTLESIARAKLGNGRLWPEIQKLNPTLDPKRMRAGKEIWLPTAAALAAAERSRTPVAAPVVSPSPSSERTYTVKKGDNYENIAISVLGSRKRVAELMALNSEIPPEKLRANQRLKLPKS